MRHLPRNLAVLSTIFLTSLAANAGEAEDALFEAARKGDAPRLVLALSEVDANTRDNTGKTALMHAAEAGDFESVRRLLWAGADASLKDNSGKIARDFLDPAGEAFAPLSLIIRCYAFCQEYGRPGGRARIPHLALVNDTWVDPSHPKLRPLYAVNEAELNGREGADDDGNGFIDDVYGWNFRNDEPLKAPQLSIDSSPETKKFLQDLMNDLLAVQQGDTKKAEFLKGRYQNPLVRQIGFQTLIQANLDLNDLAFANMFYSASHGTHVAGIIAEYSERKARLLGTAIGSFTPPSARAFTDIEGVTKLAAAAPDYSSFIVSLLDRYRGEAISQGRRASDYLRVSGAGIANMSWGRNRNYHTGIAADLEKIYQQYGKNPASIKAKPSKENELLMANLPLEITIADAAAFALAFYENPDVFIAISAGNFSENNDDLLPSPQYLSRFFPNVITIASLDEQGKPSKFTNTGVRSVQLAALGENINSTILGGLEAPMSGTSMASPLVAGVAAGIRADFPNLTATDIRRLLEASAVRSDELANICSTSGAIDVKAARLMAQSWSNDNLAMLVEEVRRAKAPGRDGPTLKVPSLTSVPDIKPVVADRPVSQPLRISHVSGSGKNWRVVMSANTGYTDQVHFGLGPWPGKEVDDAWAKGFRITSLSGAQDTWNVVMSKGVPGLQAVFGYDIDQAKIAEAMGEPGMRITSIAGWADRWLVVMSTETGYGDQRYTLPTPLNPNRRQWIDERWKEGYRITTVAGDDDPRVDNDGWLFVMTQDTGLQEQMLNGPGPWPSAWVAENQKKGFRITSVAGAADRMLVVMSKGARLSDQEISPEGEYPNQWIQQRW